MQRLGSRDRIHRFTEDQIGLRGADGCGAHQCRGRVVHRYGPDGKAIEEVVVHSGGRNALFDAHAEVGNNIELARIAGLQDIAPWGDYKGTTIGFIGTAQMDEVMGRMAPPA